MADFQAVLAPPPGFPTGGVVRVTGAWGEVCELNGDGYLVIKTQATLAHFLKAGWRSISVTHASDGGFVG